jgi:NAD(P)H dehydrogenase (quinone)
MLESPYPVSKVSRRLILIGGLMGKVLVLYHSASGNTAAMARLVAEGAGLIPGTEVRLREVDAATPDDVYWCDGLAVGSPTNMGVLSWRMKRFWDEAMFDHWGKVDGKVACAFSSSGGWGGGAEVACQSLYTVLMNFGFLVFGVTDYAGKLTTCHYGAVAAREPRDPGVKDACRLLGRRLAEWVAVVADGRRDQHPLAKPESRTLPG